MKYTTLLLFVLFMIGQASLLGLFEVYLSGLASNFLEDLRPSVDEYYQRSRTARRLCVVNLRRLNTRVTALALPAGYPT